MTNVHSLRFAVAVALVASCYNPTVPSGALRCSSNFECPGDLHCNKTDGFCYKDGEGPPGMGGGGGGRGGSGGIVGGGGMGGTTGAMCNRPFGQGFGPFPACTPMMGTPPHCDPVCQSGCSCGESCNIEGASFVCRAPTPPAHPLGDSCDAKAANSCVAGAICLEETDPAQCGAHCYRHCRADSDCPGGAHCSVEIQFGNTNTTYKVCAPPPETCNPFNRALCANATARPSPAFACYIASNRYPNETVCDCAGDKKEGETCEFEHQCVPGAECVKIGNSAMCRRVCMLGVAGGVVMGGCPPAAPNCTPFSNSTKWGYCRL